MELTADILSSCLPKEFYIGKQRSACHVAICDYSRGRMIWSIDSNKRACPHGGKFYDSFFAFSDFAEKIDSMAAHYMIMKETEVRCNRFAELIKARWPFNKFVLGCKVVDMPVLLSQLNQNTPLLTMQSIFQYDQEANRRRVGEAAKSMEWFLRKMNVFEKTGQTLLDISEDRLLKCMEQVDNSYSKDRVRLHAVYHGEGAADVGTAISLADRAEAPPISALRYLIEVESMKDPDYARKVISEARVARFTPKVDQ